MSDTMDSAIDKARELRDLHVPGDPLVLLNVWDVASARVVAASPATRAIATASWSVAAAMGYPDGEETPLETVLNLASRIVVATDLPVSVDFEKGYAADLAALEDNIRRLCQTGAVGLNIEDSIGPDDGPCWPMADAARRIEHVRRAATAEGVPIVINARTDVLAGGGEADQAIKRGNGYLQAGADCIFVLNGIGPELPRVVKEMTGPVSVLAGAGSPGVADLARMGVARISVGPGAMGVAYAALAELVNDVDEVGTWPPALGFRPGSRR
jgi:2-methylisocitrate lyase-like PEP mutase family enzyme